MARGVGLRWLVGALSVLAAASFVAGEPSKDELAKMLAGVFLIREGSPTNAEHAMEVFTAVTRQHMLSLQGFDSSLLPYHQENASQILAGLLPDPNAIANAGHPDPAYFFDPNQNFFKDFTQFLTPSGISTGSVSGPDFIDYAPCFISTTPTGVSIAADAISIIPSLITATPTGVGIAPQAINIQPSIIYVSPYGLNVSPQGINILPQLIAVAPIDYSYAPSGISVAPVGIQVAGNSRKLLEGRAGRQLQGGGPRAQGKTPNAAQKRTPSEAFIDGYQNWITLTANLIAAREGSPQRSVSFLDDVMSRASASLPDFASRFPNFQTTTAQTANGFSSFLPTFNPPVFFNDASSNVSSATAGFNVASAFINYAPCVLPTAPAGVAVAASGVNIQPVGIDITPQGINIQPQGINVQPTLIFIGPVDHSYTPVGIGVTPTLISVTPVKTSVGEAALSVGEAGITLNPDGTVTFAGEDSGGDSGGGGTR